MAIGLATVASVLGGLLIGEQASAGIDPFYANVAMRESSHRASREAHVIRDTDAGWVIETPDYGQARSTQDASYDRID